jgi:hypothetical protein
MILPTSASLLAEMAATFWMSALPLTGGEIVDRLGGGLDGLLHAADEGVGVDAGGDVRRPSRKRASARTVAVVVPSPASSEVLLAASLTSMAPMFSALLRSSISSATVTPSLVTVGPPQDLSMTALRPRGPEGGLDGLGELLDAGEKGLTSLNIERELFELPWPA